MLRVLTALASLLHPRGRGVPVAVRVASPFWGCAALDRSVALSYDDGPSTFTETLLDSLRDANATAAFFILAGAALERPETVRRVLAEGHTVGLHTWTHANLTELWLAGNAAALRHEIDDAAAVLQRITGVRPLYFRPPYGALTPGLRDYLHARGFVIALWSSGCIDWAFSSGAEDVAIYVDGMADAGGVICMHDTKENSVAATPALIAALRAADGWTNPQARDVVSLDRCTMRDTWADGAAVAL